ncbi:caspase-1-like isoform X2 [Vespa crabro]|uniref:caspase-1-like isoform X2 n=1 Tax=Vespa crabro TaxID=7445 RepID=UPI001F00BBFF|nr:caspase-1-like isoform X2 [Vespa crabro]
MNIDDELKKDSDLFDADPRKIQIKRVYPMNGEKRGLAIIFSHYKFLKRGNLRVGNKSDRKKMKALLTKFGFEVMICKDYPKRKIFKTLSEVSRMDHSNNDCLIIIVMSHGDSGILRSYDEDYDVCKLWSKFTETKCPSLKGKPKLFFIQACRGNDTDSGINLEYRSETHHRNELPPNSNSTTDVINFKLTQKDMEMFLTPNEPDFLIGYATIAGHCAFRRDKGSWYIEELCTIFKRYGRKYDILTLLTFVAQHVALKYISLSYEEPKKNDKTQIPCITHTLIKQLYFFPEEAEDVPVDLRLDQYVDTFEK